MADEQRNFDARMDSDDLYLEEMFTDRRVGTIQRLTPVTRDGGPDKSRTALYVGQTQILTPAGSLPVSFEIEAKSLGEAASKFGELAKAAVEEALERLQELRREVASSIIVPGSGAAGGGLGPVGPGPGGGSIKIP